MWVRLWFKQRDAASDPPEESVYIWTKKRLADDLLNEEAMEAAPSWMHTTERGFKYGFERVKSLPKAERDKLIKRALCAKADAEMMLAILKYKGPHP